MRNLAKFVALFEAEAIRLNRKCEHGSADLPRIYQLEMDANVFKDILLVAHENQIPLKINFAKWLKADLA